MFKSYINKCAVTILLCSLLACNMTVSASASPLYEDSDLFFADDVDTTPSSWTFSAFDLINEPEPVVTSAVETAPLFDPAELIFNTEETDSIDTTAGEPVAIKAGILPKEDFDMYPELIGGYIEHGEETFLCNIELSATCSSTRARIIKDALARKYGISVSVLASTGITRMQDTLDMTRLSRLETKITAAYGGIIKGFSAFVVDSYIEDTFKGLYYNFAIYVNPYLSDTYSIKDIVTACQRASDMICSEYDEVSFGTVGEIEGLITTHIPASLCIDIPDELEPKMYTPRPYYMGWHPDQEPYTIEEDTTEDTTEDTPEEVPPVLFSKEDYEKYPELLYGFYYYRKGYDEWQGVIELFDCSKERASEIKDELSEKYNLDSFNVDTNEPDLRYGISRSTIDRLVNIVKSPKYSGILRGIDFSIWPRSMDINLYVYPYLDASYSTKDVLDACNEAWQAIKQELSSTSFGVTVHAYIPSRLCEDEQTYGYDCDVTSDYMHPQANFYKIYTFNDFIAEPEFNTEEQYAAEILDYNRGLPRFMYSVVFYAIFIGPLALCFIAVLIFLLIKYRKR